MDGGEHARLLREADLSPGAHWKWTEVLGLAGDGRGEPPEYWRRNNWRDALSLEPLGWCRFPRMADFGLSLTDRSLHPRIRTAACELLADFPTLPVVTRLAEILLDPHEDIGLRDSAATRLGARQLGVRDEAFRWSEEAQAAADGALTQAFERGMIDELPRLRRALLHVSSPVLTSALLAAPVAAAAAAADAFATRGLAEKLLAGLPEISSAHAPRICGLVAHVLGADAAPVLVAYAQKAPLAARAEALLAALAVDERAARGAVEAWLASMPMMRTWAARAAWHLDHPGVLPVARALPVARSLGVMPAEARAKAAAEAACLFRTRAALEPFSEDELHDLWLACAWCAREEAGKELVLATEAVPRAFDRMPELTAPAIDALLTLGRADEAEKLAVERSAQSHAVWSFAQHALPDRALRMVERIRLPTVESAAGEALAQSLLGHDDMARACLAAAHPVARPVDRGTQEFPGPDELHRAQHEPARHPLLTAVVRRDVALLRTMCRPTSKETP